MLAAVVELFAMRVGYRSQTRIRRMCSGVPETPTTPSSPANRLPLGIAKHIIAHLIYDRRSLLGCSLTCCSWYIAAVPHLHHTLNLGTDYLHLPSKYKWPKPLHRMHKLGLLPLVKKLHIHQNSRGFGGLSQNKLRRRTLHQFSTLSNLRELYIDYLNIPKFMPKI